MIYPLLAAAIDAVGLILTKRSLNLFKKLNNNAFAFWLFVFIILVGLITLPWTGSVSPEAFSLRYGVMLLVVVILAANYNLLAYYGLKHDQVSHLEPLILFNPLLTILIASLAYPAERAWQVYVAAALSVLVLVWSRASGGHLRFNRAMWAMVGFSILFGLEAAIIRQLLEVYSPISLYLVRCTAALLFLWVLGRGRVTLINLRQGLMFALLGVMAVVVNGLVYFSYHTQGVSATVMVLIISPVLVYFLSSIFLREKLSFRNILASLVVVALVVWASLTR